MGEKERKKAIEVNVEDHFIKLFHGLHKHLNKLAICSSMITDATKLKCASDLQK